MITDEDFQKEQKVLQKAARWFGDPMYVRYMETIKKLLRRKISVDAIRYGFFKRISNFMIFLYGDCIEI